MDYRQPVEKRLLASNIAEEKCEEYLNTVKGLHWSRFGFDETNNNVPFVQFRKVPGLIRNAPDYVCIASKPFFIEAKGFKDGLKIKEADLKSYSYWNSIMDLYFFAYDCHREKFHKLPYSYILKVLPVSGIDKYKDNNKQYYIIDL